MTDLSTRTIGPPAARAASLSRGGQVAYMEAKGGEEAGDLIMAQVAFPKLEERELFLLGAAIKYAGSKGVTVTIAADGSDRTTANSSTAKCKKSRFQSRAFLCESERKIKPLTIENAERTKVNCKTTQRKQRCGGRGGIRTHGTLAGTPVFKTGALNHSATLPTVELITLFAM